jgi:hypothetical protein
MTQYINLVNPALRKRREPISALTLAAALGALFVVLASAHIYVRLRADARQAELQQLQARLKVEQERLGGAEKAVAEARPDARLRAEIAALREALKARQAAMAVLEQGALGDTEGFSGQFRAFARQSMDGLWLTGFALSGAGRDMLIQGRALSAEKVPAYIRRLNGEAVFQGRSFAALAIEEGKPAEVAGAADPARKPPPYLEFQLVSSPERAAKLGGAAEDVPALRGLGEGRQ